MPAARKLLYAFRITDSGMIRGMGRRVWIAGGRMVGQQAEATRPGTPESGLCRPPTGYYGDLLGMAAALLESLRLNTRSWTVRSAWPSSPRRVPAPPRLASPPRTARRVRLS